MKQKQSILTLTIILAAATVPAAQPVTFPDEPVPSVSRSARLRDIGAIGLPEAGIVRPDFDNSGWANAGNAGVYWIPAGFQRSPPRFLHGHTGEPSPFTRFRNPVDGWPNWAVRLANWFRSRNVEP
jgi:hypothetical protein